MNAPLFIVVLMSLLPVVLVVAELSVRRLLWKRGDYVWRPFERTQMHLDAKALPQLLPLVHFDVNCDGERGARPPRDSRSAWRVLVVGGSAAECFLLDQQDSWPEVLAKELEVNGFLSLVGRRRIHVGNIAKSGVDSAGLNLILDRVLSRYKRLDCIIFSIGAGDIQNWLCRGAPSPFYPAELSPRRLFFGRNQRAYGWRPRETALAELARTLRDRLTIQQRYTVGKKLSEARLMRSNASEFIDEIPDPSGMLDCLEKNLRELIAKARLKADHLLVLPQPWFDKDAYAPEEERLLWHAPKGKPYEEKVTTYYSFRVFNALMRQVRETIFKSCVELGVLTLDLTAVLPNDTETYYDQLHFTDVGSRRVGRAVAASLKEAAAGLSAKAGIAAATSASAVSRGRRT